MTGRAISQYFHLPQDEDILFLRWSAKPDPQLPMITVVHEDRPMLKKPQELERSKGKFRHKRVIFLARDPRDVIVSSYFEMRKRGDIFGENPYEARKAVYSGELSDFIDRRQGGFDTILTYYNIWAENRHIPQEFLLVRYEDMKQDPHTELRQVLDLLRLTMIDDGGIGDTINEAVEFAAFENMRKMELKGSFRDGILNPAVKSDQELYKTRRGQVGGYREYLTDDEIQRLNKKMMDDLSKYYGYSG